MIRILIFLLLLFLAYYSGYQEWGTDVLLGWTEVSSLPEFLSETWNGLWDWITDQELGNQVEEQIDRVKDAVSQ
mgnify:CR=1 FL=1